LTEFSDKIKRNISMIRRIPELYSRLPLYNARQGVTLRRCWSKDANAFTYITHVELTLKNIEHLQLASNAMYAVTSKEFSNWDRRYEYGKVMTETSGDVDTVTRQTPAFVARQHRSGEHIYSQFYITEARISDEETVISRISADCGFHVPSRGKELLHLLPSGDLFLVKGDMLHWYRVSTTLEVGRFPVWVHLLLGNIFRFYYKDSEEEEELFYQVEDFSAWFNGLAESAI
jgi:hypothetical protein